MTVHIESPDTPPVTEDEDYTPYFDILSDEELAAQKRKLNLLKNLRRLPALLEEAGELIKAYARQKTLDVPDMDAYAEELYARICKMLEGGSESETR